MNTLMQYRIFQTDTDYIHVCLCSNNDAFYIVIALYVGDCHVASAVTRCNGFLHALEVYESNRP